MLCRTACKYLGYRFSNGWLGNNIFDGGRVNADVAEFLTIIIWQVGHFGFNGRHVFVGQQDWRNVWIGHVAVVVGVLFAALRDGDELSVIPPASFLDDGAAVFEEFNLACDFVFDSFLDRTE